MTDQTETDGIDAVSLDKNQLLDILDQMADDVRGVADFELRLKTLDRALSHAAIVKEHETVTAASIVATANTFLAFLKGE